MYNHRANLGHTANQLGAISWFISFGDLLTLLVCFFLLLTPRFATQHQQDQRGQGVIGSKQSARILGTALAYRISDVKAMSIVAVPVWNHDVRAESRTNTAGDDREEWLDAIVEQASHGATATVQVCQGESEGEVLSKVLQAVRGVGESVGRVILELEAECEVWRKHFASSQHLVGVVQFSRN